MLRTVRRVQKDPPYRLRRLAPQGPVLQALLLRGGDLIEAPLMASALEGRREPERENLVGEPERDNTPAHREDVRVVVLARKACRVEIVAERRANPHDLVRRDLFALSAAAEHDAAVRASFGDRAADRDADRRIVDRRLAVRAVVVHAVAESRERLAQMFFQQESRVIGADSHSHSG